MTKNIMTKTTKFLLAFVLVLGGFNATTTSAFAQETKSSDSVVELTSDNAQDMVAELALEMQETTAQTTSTLIGSFATEIVAPTPADAPTSFAVDQELVDAQTAAIVTLTESIAKMDAAIDASINMTDEQKAAEKDVVLTIANAYTNLISAATTVEEVDALVLEITGLTTLIVDLLAALDTAKTEAVAQLDDKLAQTVAAINALTSLTAEEKQAFLDEAQTNYDLALEAIMMSSDLEMVQANLDLAIEIFDIIIWASNFDDRINAINARLQQAHEIITNDTRLTNAQANALIESLNAIVNQANIDLEAAITIEELDAILNAAISDLNVILDSIIYPSIEISKSVDKMTAFVGDVLTYTLTIKNTGTVEISTLVLSEVIDTNLVSKVAGSETTDVFVMGAGNETGFGGQLRTILPNETVNVTFQVVVLEAALNQAITNSFTVTSTQLAPETLESNTVVTNVVDDAVTLTPGDGNVLPNTGLDNTSLFLSASALMVGALTLVLALKRNRNV